MKKKLYIILIIIAISCSKKQTIDERMIGDWTIDKYDIAITDIDNGTIRTYSYKDLYFLSFYKDHTGINNISKVYERDFTWTTKNESIIINEKGEPLKVYTVNAIDNTTQVWKISYLTVDSLNISETINMHKEP